MITVHDKDDKEINIAVDKIISVDKNLYHDNITDVCIGNHTFYCVKESPREIMGMFNDAWYNRYTLFAEALRNMGVGC